MKISLLPIIIMALAGNALADEQNPLADLPWQIHPIGPRLHWFSYPWEGYAHTATLGQVSEPEKAGSLFETINWYQHKNDLNAGSSIEYLSLYQGVCWWDFIGGHHVLSSDNVLSVNEALPLRLSYIELTFGYPGPDHHSWWQVPFKDGRDGLVQLMPDDNIGGWVTQVRFYASPVPDTGTTLGLMTIGLVLIAVRRLMP